MYQKNKDDIFRLKIQEGTTTKKKDKKTKLYDNTKIFKNFYVV